MKEKIKKLFVRFVLHYPFLFNDKFYLKVLYPHMMRGEKLNIDNPTLFTEKLQWLKLYDRNPSYTKMADKCEVKKYVASIIGDEHVIPLYGVWDSFDKIDFDSLPNEFVLKCTHDSGGYVVCKDKSTFDKNAAKTKLEKTLVKNYFWQNREWVYKNIQPRIIAEKYMPSLGNADSVEYKITCINGKVMVITVCGGIPHAAYELRSNDNYDRDWNRQEWYAFYKPTNKKIERPKQMDDIIEFSERLSKDIPQVRVDWYIIDGVVYFGEMTFYTWSGFIHYTPEKWNKIMGDWLMLPNRK